jgi:hypothetical protein
MQPDYDLKDILEAMGLDCLPDYSYQPLTHHDIISVSYAKIWLSFASVWVEFTRYKYYKPDLRFYSLGPGRGRFYTIKNFLSLEELKLMYESSLPDMEEAFIRSVFSR